jgi:hypothetical protein
MHNLPEGCVFSWENDDSCPGELNSNISLHRVRLALAPLFAVDKMDENLTIL